MPLLAFRLYGPLAACGTAEAGEELRPSARHFGRGAILGMVAAALGLTRDDEDGHASLRDGLLVAVASSGPRRIVRDYRTVQTVEPRAKQTFVSRRDALANGKVHTKQTYRQHVEGGLWRAFLAPRGGFDLAPLAAALRNPRFEIHLGRRDMPPALPLLPALLDCGLVPALTAFPAVPAVPAKLGHPKGKELRRLYDGLERAFGPAQPTDLAWDEGFPGAPDSHTVTSVQDDPVSRTRWRFIRRREARATILPDREKAGDESLAAQFWPAEPGAGDGTPLSDAEA